MFHFFIKIKQDNKILFLIFPHLKSFIILSHIFLLHINFFTFIFKLKYVQTISLISFSYY